MGPPLIGETLAFLRESTFATDRHRRYGPIFKTRILGQPTIFLTGSESNRFVLSNEDRYFVTTWPASTKALLGENSLAVQTGDLHLNRRKLMAQAFQPRALSGYIETMTQITRRYLQKWAEAGSITWYPELRQYTFDVATQLLVGLDQGCQTSLGELFEIWAQGLFSIPLAIPGTPFGQAMGARRQLLSELRRLIEARQQQSSPTQSPTKSPTKDVLGILLQAQDEQGQSLGMEELQEQILTLLFAGHETLTSALCSLGLLLAQHPIHRDRIRAQQYQIPYRTSWSMEDLQQMTAIDPVLQEVLRLIPPVGGGFRQVLQECELEGYRIPKGWTVLYQIGGTHQEPEIYTQPEQFDPERFAGVPPQGKPGSSYIPFGGGIRECLGKEFAKLEMKLFTALLVRDYDWELQPDQNLEMRRVPTPHPIDGLKVTLRRL